MADSHVYQTISNENIPAELHRNSAYEIWSTLADITKCSAGLGSSIEQLKENKIKIKIKGQPTNQIIKQQLKYILECRTGTCVKLGMCTDSNSSRDCLWSRIVVHLYAGDVSNLGPIFPLLSLAPFSQQRTSSNNEINQRHRQPFFWHCLELRAPTDD